MGIFSGERPANDTDAETIWDGLKRLLNASHHGIDVIGVPDSEAQGIYEQGQGLLKQEIGGNKRRGTGKSN
ncbi:MAG: hypothetical protein KBC74_02705 [Candidatus Pacebacteria bacterium]|nr:hypothetical protein [Candidatus Paceibacterota bacterium]MBP9832408.1 hypothetical protein [Candidatus Paceibacterota bacterium]